MNAHLAGNLALDKTAVQHFTYLSRAHNAVDGDKNTASCTSYFRHEPWWAVDLGEEYNISSVIIITPDVNGDYRNYR